MADSQPDRRIPHAAIDATVAHPARIWNYWLAGKDHFAVDRQVGDQTTAAYPHIRQLARAQRAFLARVVRYLAGEVGIRQFLDIGTGLPTANNTHEVAQAVAPACRVVYVDNDPLVLAHAQALLTSHPEGVTDYVDADLRDPDQLLHAAARTLDLTRPVAVTMLGVLIFLTDDQQAYQVVDRLVDALPSGSYLVATHTTNAVHGAAADEAVRIWNEGGSTPMVIRSPQQIRRFFSGLELVEPGLVPVTRWRPETLTDDEDVDEYAAVARKP